MNKFILYGSIYDVHRKKFISTIDGVSDGGHRPLIDMMYCILDLNNHILYVAYSLIFYWIEHIIL